ncbi:MAG: sigma-70 family RNA polymerase sigma factor [Armatimonadetes bacterium]|nr:sigma-70 family RNA polymerase sigma factor [Armatimonadota bacterium]MDW8122815.1 sigma-70 family RNA polymerase sigma factor [Armatimonadota bacterium]
MGKVRGKSGLAKAPAPSPARHKPPFEEVVDQYYDSVLNLAYRLTNDRDEADDLTQEVFLHAGRAYDQFRGEAQVFTWLFRITHNLWKNRLKKLQREREHRWEILEDAEADEDDPEPLFWEDTTLSPERILEAKEKEEAIQKAIMELPEDQRFALILYHIEDLSYQEIAHVLGCSVEAVKSRLFRARTALRRKLAHLLT